MKKQMMKTSVLAAVLLSMGMGMAHAATGDVLGHSTVVVNGSVGAATCEVKIDKGPEIKLGSVIASDFKTKDTLIAPQDLKVSLTNCTKITDSNGKVTSNVDLQIVGPNTQDGNKYFGLSSLKVGHVAVGIAEKSSAITLLENGHKIPFAGISDALATKNKEFTVGLVAKDPTTLEAGMDISAPLTFQLIER
ncbi:fimbrial protein [Photorhabdus africana]|uniref:fimbrial protein n=1 Tax=Photorhabdus africana TaxID=3097554 RepID=UPI002B415592|nr:fimbrial protein [Photorhabdus sp. CRI-LC]